MQHPSAASSRLPCSVIEPSSSYVNHRSAASQSGLRCRVDDDAAGMPRRKLNVVQEHADKPRSSAREEQQIVRVGRLPRVLIHTSPAGLKYPFQKPPTAEALDGALANFGIWIVP